MEKLDYFFQLYPIVEKVAIEIVVLHLEGEANDWWFKRLKHARVTVYAEFTQILVNMCDRRNPEAHYIETFFDNKEKVHEEQKGDQLPPPPPERVLAHIGGALEFWQEVPNNLTFRFQGMIQEVHEEEEVDTSAGAVVEEHPSPSREVGEEIELV